MKKLLIGSVAFFAFSGIAAAWDSGPTTFNFRKHLTAPEISAASAAAALTLLVGGLVVMRGRKTGKAKNSAN